MIIAGCKCQQWHPKCQRTQIDFARELVNNESELYKYTQSCSSNYGSRDASQVTHRLIQSSNQLATARSFLSLGLTISQNYAFLFRSKNASWLNLIKPIPLHQSKQFCKSTNLLKLIYPVWLDNFSSVNSLHSACSYLITKLRW